MIFFSLLIWIAFAIETLLVAATVLVLVNAGTLLGVSRDRQNEIYEKIVKFWAHSAFKLIGIDISGEGLDNLRNQRGPFVMMSNHQSYLDPPLMIALSPVPLRFVAKRELMAIPLFGSAMEAIGHIMIDRSNRESAVASMQAAVRDIGGRTVGIVVYPEGTRANPPDMKEFKKGGFMMALDGGIPIIPAGLRGTSAALRQDSPLVNRSVSPSMHVGKPVDVNAYGYDRRDELMHRVRDDITALRGNNPC